MSQCKSEKKKKESFEQMTHRIYLNQLSKSWKKKEHSFNTTQQSRS